MSKRQEIQAELDRRLAHGEAALERLKDRMAAAGHEVNAEAKEAAAAAEQALAKGRAKLSDMAAATDEQFDEMWANTKDAWHDFEKDAERGWENLSDRVKSFFT